MTGESLVVLCTCADLATARDLAHLVVEQQVAACVNILPNIISVYRWEHQVTSENEYLLIIKTHSAVYQALEAALIQQHPYQIPEVIALPIIQGLPSYLNWMLENIKEQ